MAWHSPIFCSFPRETNIPFKTQKVQGLFTFSAPRNRNRMTIKLFFLFNQWLSIRSFGRREIWKYRNKGDITCMYTRSTIPYWNRTERTQDRNDSHVIRPNQPTHKIEPKRPRPKRPRFVPTQHSVPAEVLHQADAGYRNHTRISDWTYTSTLTLVANSHFTYIPQACFICSHSDLNSRTCRL